MLLPGCFDNIMALFKQCLTGGCPGEAVYHGLCADHGRAAQRKVDKDRGSSSSRGYDRRWRMARARYLSEYPLCDECLSYGKTVAATVVDHIVPHRGDMTLFWDRLNWQSLCKTCHDRKTFRGE